MKNTMFSKLRQIEFILKREVNINKLKFNLIHLLPIELINTEQAVVKIKIRNTRERSSVPLYILEISFI